VYGAARQITTYGSKLWPCFHGHKGAARAAVIGVHYCIIFHYHIMLYIKKNEIFIAFFSLFSGPTLMEMKAHQQ